MTSLRSAVPVAVAIVSLAACTAGTGGDLFGPAPGSSGIGGPVDNRPPGSSGTSGTSSGTTSGTVSSGGPCTGLACQQVDCGGGPKTTLTGKVYDPAGANTLYDVVVYVPAGPLPALTAGAGCDACGPIDAVVQTRTNDKGVFVLEDVPVVKDLPIVVQIGKWRRTINVDASTKCAENKVPDRALRLPKNGSEGDMPHFAVTAGGCDALECLLRGIGIDDSEFVPGTSTAGHVHVFNGSGGNFPGAPSAGGSPSDKLGGQLWNDVSKLQKYDSVLLSCECDESNDNKGGPPGTPGARQALYDYANAGGRIVATHYHYTWLKNSPQSDWRALANWSTGTAGAGSYDVDMSFPRGSDFASWLVANNATTTMGSIPLTDVTSSLSAVSPPAQSWIKKPGAVTFFTVPTPTSGPTCGQVAFTDLHVMGISGGGQTFPNACPAAGGLNAQQKALEFQIFEMSACGK